MSTKFPAFWAFSPLYSMTLFTPIVPCNTGTSQICKALKLYTQLPSKCLHFDVPKAAYRSNISKVKHLLYPQIAILSVSLFKWMVVVATNLSQKAKCHPRLYFSQPLAFNQNSSAFTFLCPLICGIYLNKDLPSKKHFENFYSLLHVLNNPIKSHSLTRSC